MSMNALLNDGDEVLIPAPDYPLWTAVGRAVGRHAGALPLRRGQPAGCPTSTTSGARSRRARAAIVVINPNNPTGALYPDALLREDRRARAPARLIVFADEIYDKTLYDGDDAHLDRLARRRRAVPHLQRPVEELPLVRLPRRLDGRLGREAPRARLHRGPEHAGVDAPVLEHAGPARDPDRARRLPEHRRPGRAGRPARAPARPRPRAADGDSRA